MSGDLILIRGLRVLAYCGVLDEEQERRQPFRLDVEIGTDLAAAGTSDDIADTIHYGDLTDQVVELIESNRFALLEHLSHRVAELVLRDPRAETVTVEIHKLRPPVAHDLACSGVRITRSR